MKKKIVILSAFLTPFRSGAEACAEEVPLLLADQFDFTIVTARMRRNLPKKDILRGKTPVIRVGVGVGVVDKWLYPFLAPIVVRKIKPDVVHAILETFAGLALVFCRAPKKILTCQTTNRTFLKGFILKSPDIVTAISKSLVAICKRCGRNDIHLIPNGIHLHAIREAVIAHHPEQDSVLFVGRLEPMKGVDTLIEAFALVAKQHDAHLTIIGSGSQRGVLENLAKQLGVANRITFKGYVEQGKIEQEYARATIFMALSRSEALGNVFLEAQAAGCAVIGTSVGGIPDIIEQERTGLLVAPNDPAAAAIALLRLLTDKNLRDRLGSSGRSNAERYDWTGIAKRYAELYR